MTPAYEVDVGDAALTERSRRLLEELRVTQTTDRESDSVELVFTDPIREFAEPRRGRTIAVRLGYAETALHDLGSYIHSGTQIELAPRVLRVQAAAADFSARSKLKAPRTFAWHETTVGEIVEAIAGRHGLDHAVSESLAGEAIEHIDQTSESDVHFLRRLARQYDATTKLVSGRILFMEAGASATATTRQKLEPVVIRPPSEGERKLLVGNVRRNDKSRYGTVRAKYYDVDEATHVYVTAGSGEPVYNMRNPYPDRPQAEAAAKGKLAKLTRSTGHFSVTIPGNPAAKAGARLSTEGWTGGEDGEWTVTRVVHTLRPLEGYRTQITAEAFVGN